MILTTVPRALMIISRRSFRCSRTVILSCRALALMAIRRWPHLPDEVQIPVRVAVLPDAFGRETVGLPAGNAIVPVRPDEPELVSPSMIALDVLSPAEGL